MGGGKWTIPVVTSRRRRIAASRGFHQFGFEPLYLRRRHIGYVVSATSARAAQVDRGPRRKELMMPLRRKMAKKCMASGTGRRVEMPGMASIRTPDRHPSGCGALPFERPAHDLL